MKSNAFLDIPPDLSPSSPDFVRVLNDRLRRLASLGSGSQTRVAGSGVGGDDNYVELAMNSLGQVVIDLKLGSCFHLTLSAATAGGSPLATIASILAPTDSSRELKDGRKFELNVDQDTTGNWAAPGFAAGPGGFVVDVAMQGLALNPDTRSVYSFRRRNSMWGLATPIVTGAPIS